MAADVGHHIGDLLPHMTVVARDQAADVDDHVQLARAVLQGKTRFEDLRLGPRAAVRKTDHRPNGDRAARQQVACTLDVPRAHANGGDVVRCSQPAPALDERIIELRLQERMVDRLGNVQVAEPVEKRGHQVLLTGLWSSTTKSTSRAYRSAG